MANRINKTVNKNIASSKLKGPRLLPLKKAAGYLGLTVWSMRERIWAGDIPVVRFPGGRKMFIDVLDLEDYIQRNKETFK
jgi:hypothetical protein